jgi:hypothetical protein
MFGNRKDGKKLKNLPPEFRLIPILMKERDDSQVFFKTDISITAIEEYIDKKKEEGITLGIMDVIFATVIRMISERPLLNRFCINGMTYARNEITTSLSIKKSKTDDGEETTIKIHWNGDENIFDVAKKLQKYVAYNKESKNENNTDKTADFLNKLPTWLYKLAVGMLIHLDKKGRLPKSIIEASPFHTSAFITNVGSIGIDSIYHHIYNFGTTSLFFAMGKKKKDYIYEDEELKQEKVISVAFVGDERICDGYYFANTFRQMERFWRKPELLEEKPVRKYDPNVPVKKNKTNIM